MVNIVERIRSMPVSQDPNAAVSMPSVVSIIELIIEAEPEVIAILPVLFPGNAVVAKAVTLLPTLLGWLQKIEQILNPPQA